VHGRSRPAVACADCDGCGSRERARLAAIVVGPAQHRATSTPRWQYCPQPLSGRQAALASAGAAGTVRVLVAMSGGVDSSVAAARMVDAGHDVVGVHLALSAAPGTLRTGSARACSKEDAGGRAFASPMCSTSRSTYGISRIAQRRRDRRLRVVICTCETPNRVCGATSESSSPRWPFARWHLASTPSQPAITRGSPTAGYAVPSTAQAAGRLDLFRDGRQSGVPYREHRVPQFARGQHASYRRLVLVRVDGTA